VELLAQLADHSSVLDRTVHRETGAIAEVVARVCSCFRSGSRLFFCGNGGSAADAQHFAAEFVNRLHLERRALPALALTTDTSILTCVANDDCYEQVFARQIEALGSEGDVLVALSTSGTSANVLAAIEAARAAGMTVVGFTGDGGVEPLAGRCDIVVPVASEDCARIQEGHEFLWHVIADLVEQELFVAR
jgi:D-sedoheptulose 7-phosphate isomerase